MSRYLVLLTVLVLAACATSPTGRPQLLLFDDRDMAQMGLTAYRQLQQKTPRARDNREVAYVQCIATSLTRELPGGGPAWEVTLFADDQVNAFALPGGKIGVYTGIFKVAQTPDQLAAVVGHEIAHVLARHANARVSRQYATQTGLQVVQMAAGTRGYGDPTLWSLIGLGAQVGLILPYGRDQELEADILGLDLMADAGFDPRAAPSLWQNMARQGGNKPPVWLSTHPSDQQRFAELHRRLAVAVPRYEQAIAKGKRPGCRR